MNIVKMFSFFILILFLPLFSSISIGLFGRYMGNLGSSYLAIFSMIFVTILSYFAFYFVGLKGEVLYFDLFTWMDIGLLNVHWGMLLDSLSVVMIIVVNTVSMIVHIFSLGYMRQDPHLSRFMAYLSFFTFFMLMLVTSNNFIQLFLGWEGVGLCSYLLIGFWYTRVQAVKSALKALIMNKIGDFGVLSGIIIIFLVFNSVDYSIVFSLVPYFFNKNIYFLFWECNIITLIGFLLFIGAVGKSAQFGLHTWLPDAMEGPTPVSALIHAATMVTAGVFLIIRCSPLFEYSPTMLSIITIVGALTAFFAATAGVVQNDLKKVIAYSTCSQLGYMVFSCGLSGYYVSLFHLSNHAFFKALLFLSAGCVIHGMSDEQDMRRMGGLIKVMPLIYMFFLIGSLALIGFPFLTGFYSKDVIIEIAYTKYCVSSLFSFWLGSITAGLTAFYSFRLIILTFIVKTNSYKKVIEGVHEPDNIMLIPLFLLVFGSLFFGFISKELFLGLGSDFFLNSIFVHPQNIVFIDAEFIPFYIKIVPVVFSLFGVFLSFFVYCYFFNFEIITKTLYSFKNYKIFKIYNFIYNFFNKKWFIDNVYNLYIGYPIYRFGYNVAFKLIDKGFIEFVGPYGLSILFFSAGQYYKNNVLKGNLVYYIKNILTFTIFLLIFLLLHIIFFAGTAS